ncbi:MAG: formyl transferase [Bacteroidales bacterium]|nr:formyl transferase [Bacteroidales bacterium]
MIIKVIGDPGAPAYQTSLSVVRKLGHAVHDSRYFYCDLAVAPLLTFRLSPDEINEPIHGTLIFHPSPLPYGRGASSLRWAYRRKEPITAACWFWATERLDAGDICESEIIKIDYSMSPKAYYHMHVLPALERTLQQALKAISGGYIRRIPQQEAYASYDLKL